MRETPAPDAPLRFSWRGLSRTIAVHSSDIDGTQVPNSLAAVRACLAAGAPRIEIDLRILADGTFVVFHDANLDPSTDRRGRLDELRWDDVKSARLKANPEFLIPRFEEVIALVAGSATELHVDLKPMNFIAAQDLDRLAETMHPLADMAFVGSQASWTLDALARRGVRTAFDPFRHIHRWPDRPPGETALPRGQSLHDFWDDALCGLVANMPPQDYAALRIEELVRQVPAATEWMVEKSTVLHFASLGVELGHALHERGIQLSAWTLKDEGGEVNRRRLEELFRLGVDVIIADNALAFAASFAGGTVNPNP